MKRKLLLIAATLLIAISIVGVTSCQWFFDALGAGLFSVSGTAVNVAQPLTVTEYWKGSTDTTLTLTGAEITLVNVYDSSKTYTATVDSYGDWTALSVAAGKYRITGDKTGWTFIPKEIEITGLLSSAEPILAYETPSNTDEILIVVEWQRPENVAALDVDSILVLDQGTTGTGQSAVFSSAFDYGSSTEYDVPARYSGTAVTQDRDVYGTTNLQAASAFDSDEKPTPLVETIRIKSNPFGTNDGQLRYFLNAFNSATLTGDSFATTPIPSTYATVTVMQASSTATDGLLGIFNIALDSYEKTLGVVKIDVDYTGSATVYTVKSYGNEGTGVMKSLAE